jgi:uncharacterized LabA/DUF88 family protein
MASNLISAFDIHPSERVAVFLDVRNLTAAARQLGIQVDFKRLRDGFAGTRFGRLDYFALTARDLAVICPAIQLLDWLRFNGFSVFEKPVPLAVSPSTGKLGLSGTVVGEMTVSLLSTVPAVDHVILFSGDRELCAAVREIRRHNIKVTVISSLKTEAGSISAALRSEADAFFELDDLREMIERAPVPAFAPPAVHRTEGRSADVI